MEELASVGLVGAASILAGYLVALGFRPDRTRKPRVNLDLRPGTIARVIVPGGAYRCRIDACAPQYITFSAPLHQDTFVPLRPGQTVVVQIGDAGGLLTFRSEILARDSRAHTLCLAQPRHFRHSERRSEPRLKEVDDFRVMVDGQTARLVDLSARGAKAVTAAHVKPGDRVRLSIEEAPGEAVGSVLESRWDTLGGRPAREVRIMFDEPFEGVAEVRRGHLTLLRATGPG
ncbi:MAG: flagellar brake protein [Fimbriimonadaceae bacterium]|nr:flagellar brake protein [Fimbriimonadaceae bacterium]QYK55567.1 MAG: flagellar brake protein [Fimbriimonadaceae bacterium]